MACCGATSQQGTVTAAAKIFIISGASLPAVKLTKLDRPSLHPDDF